MKMSVALSVALSVAALVVSGIAVFFAIQTYRAAYRPYVGVVGAKYVQTVAGPPQDIQWAWRIRNVGSVPARITSSQQKITIAFGQKRQTFTTGPAEGPRIAMPEQENLLTGDIFDEPKKPPQVQNILSGNVPVEVRVAISYESPGVFLGSRTYTYESTYQLVVKPNLGFILVGGDAN